MQREQTHRRARSLLVLGALALASSIRAPATTYELADPATAVVGADFSVRTVYEDTLYDLARRYSLGSEELIRVNPHVDPWLPGADRELLVPSQHVLPASPREGIVVNLPEHRLYFYPKPARGKPQQVITFPVSIGKMDWRTPIGETRIIAKQKDPTWYPTASVRREHAAAGETLPAQVPPGPDNPLGNFALRLAVGKGTYLIHGTNNPIAVGLAVTHGCIRMYPEDIELLFGMVKVGTKVRIIDAPVKVAWVDGELLLEAHPPINAVGETLEPDLPQFETLLAEAVGDSTVAIHWDYAREVLQRADGVLATVGLAADTEVPGAQPEVPAAEPEVPAATAGVATPEPDGGRSPP
ncbi:MAG: L,D-transpeptidase family protein [Gammaproteobacteria bacterium]|nr:L,D-transpeptidase family protein [Gammaproteobacteria bacterium]